MKDLIAAFEIFGRYTKAEYPTSCGHDVLYVHVNPAHVTGADVQRLAALGFQANMDDENFYSYRFGSA